MQKDLFPMLGNSAQKIFDSGNWSQWKKLIGIQSRIQTCPCASSFQLSLSVSNPSEQPDAFFIVREGKQMSQGAHIPWRSPKPPHCQCKILSYPVDITLVSPSMRDISTGWPTIVPNIPKYSLPETFQEELQRKFYQISLWDFGIRGSGRASSSYWRTFTWNIKCARVWL